MELHSNLFNLSQIKELQSPFFKPVNEGKNIEFNGIHSEDRHSDGMSSTEACSDKIEPEDNEHSQISGLPVMEELSE